MQNSPRNDVSLHVIHIEDNENDGELIRLALKRCGTPCEIRRVSTGEQFQSAIENNQIDLILSDSKVPGFDAWGALKFTHQRKPNVPFVFVSGNTAPHLKEEALERGAADYIPKDNLAALTNLTKKIWERKLERLHKKLPPVGEFVIVRCPGFRCLGYLDSEGNWRDFARSEILPNVVDWFEK